MNETLNYERNLRKELMMKLPTKQTKPEFDIEKMLVYIYGAPKIGKTTFAADFPNAVFLATEPGHKYVEIAKVDCNDWSQIIEATNALKETQHGFKTVVVDVVDNAFNLCREFVLQKLGIKHESEAQWGKGFSAVKDEWKAWIKSLGETGLGIIYISHVTEKAMPASFTDKAEVEKKMVEQSGKSYIIPTLPKAAAETIEGQVDCIFYAKYDSDTKQRIIDTQPNDERLAGDRTGFFKNIKTFPLSYTGLCEVLKPFSISPEKAEKAAALLKEEFEKYAEAIELCKDIDALQNVGKKIAEMQIAEPYKSKLRSCYKDKKDFFELPM